MRESEKTILWIIKIGLWLIPFLPLYVSSSMLFPFITGKNFAFRIITEIVFALWAALALARPEFRPRLTPVFKAATVFTAAVFLADLLGPNPYRSFFSNYERMEGFMMVFHLYLYFTALASVFKTRRDWLVFFHTTLLASVAVSYVALLQKLGYRISVQGGFRVDSTIGNPTYLAAYLFFHVWIAFLLLYQFRKKLWLAFFYGAVLAFELAIIYFTATRGAVLALAATAVFFAAAVAAFWNRLIPANFAAGDGLKTGGGWSAGRKTAALVLVFLAALPVILFALRRTDFVRSSPVLERITNYSLEERTIQSRLKIWKMSAAAFLERPLLGWGQENYYLVFQKYFDPGLYAQEPWFDRSHNIVFDWLIHTGLAGLLAYLSMIGAVLWGIIEGTRKRAVELWQALVVAAIFLGHFIQNIFVFDNLNTYILFFAFLAYGGGLSSDAHSVGSLNSRRKIKPPGACVAGRGETRLILFGSAFLLIVVFAGYFLHWKPIKESKTLIEALKLHQAQVPLGETAAVFKEALNYRTFGDTETREQLSNAARIVLDNPKFGVEDKKKFAEFAAEELEKETAYPAKDVKHILFRGALLNRLLEFDSSYARRAEETLAEALRLSPQKQIIYFELAQFYLSAGRGDDALDILRKAWELDKSYTDAGANLLTVAVLLKKTDLIPQLKSSLGLKDMREESLYRIALAAQRVENFKEALDMYAELVARYPQNSRYRASYAALLAYFGRTEEAKKEAEEAARLDPDFRKEADDFLKILEKN